MDLGTGRGDPALFTRRLDRTDKRTPDPLSSPSPGSIRGGLVYIVPLRRLYVSHWSFVWIPDGDLGDRRRRDGGYMDLRGRRENFGTDSRRVNGEVRPPGTQSKPSLEEVPPDLSPPSELEGLCSLGGRSRRAQ